MNGLLILDKPAGMTSHDVVARTRRIVGERSIGHLGTLDPMATGVLVLLLGRATRLARFVTGRRKRYDAVIRLGRRTDTNDAWGATIDDAPPAAVESLPDREAVVATPRLVATIDEATERLSAYADVGVDAVYLQQQNYSLEALAKRSCSHGLGGTSNSQLESRRGNRARKPPRRARRGR